MAPPCFFGFGAAKSTKLNLGTFLALKTTWKAILNIFWSLSLVARGWQISIDIVVETFKILSFKGVMHLKWKLRTCTIQFDLEKVGFVGEKIKFFEIFWFLPNAREPSKLFDVQFFQFLARESETVGVTSFFFFFFSLVKIFYFSFFLDFQVFRPFLNHIS